MSSVSLIPAVSSAQISAQVEAYLGAAKFTTDAPKGQCAFVFENKTEYRQGDGATTWEKLLPKTPPGISYNDKADFGRLALIKVNRHTVPAAVQPETKQAGTLTRVEPGVMKTEKVIGVPGAYVMVPDSVQLQGFVQKSTGAIPGAIKVMGDYTRPFVHGTFEALKYMAPLILLILGLLSTVVKTSQENGWLGSTINQVGKAAAATSFWIIAPMALWLAFCGFHPLFFGGHYWTSLVYSIFVGFHFCRWAINRLNANHGYNGNQHGQTRVNVNLGAGRNGPGLPNG